MDLKCQLPGSLVVVGRPTLVSLQWRERNPKSSGSWSRQLLAEVASNQVKQQRQLQVKRVAAGEGGFVGGLVR